LFPPVGIVVPGPVGVVDPPPGMVITVVAFEFDPAGFPLVIPPDG